VSAPEDTPLDRARAAALAELRRAPEAVPWRRDAWRLGAAFVGVGLGAAALALAAGLARPADAAAHVVTLGALAFLAVRCGFLALAPGAARGREALGVAVGGGLAVMNALAFTRLAAGASATPEWVCSASHFALDLVPAWIALRALGGAAWTWPRALAAGVGAGTAGALLGELACRRGPTHVLVHHVGAWLAIVTLVVVVSRARRPRAFAP
jgi:hypothetical protein